MYACTKHEKLAIFGYPRCKNKRYVDDEACLALRASLTRSRADDAVRNYRYLSPRNEGFAVAPSPFPIDDSRIRPDQPAPLACHVSALDGVTAIARTWAPGDTARCRLCPACTAHRGLCVIQVEGPVADAAAPLFARRGPPGDLDAV